MPNESLTKILDLLKAGGILAGVVVTMAIFIVIFKYVLPLLRPNGTGTAPMLEALRSLTGLPAEVKSLTTEIRGFNRTIEEHVPTKAEMLQQFQTNRHDVRNTMQEIAGHLQLDIQQLTGVKMRKLQRRRKERRK